MVDGQDAGIDAVVSQSNQEHKNPRVAQLVDRFMAQVELATDGDDWKEADGWVGRMVLWDGKACLSGERKGKQTYVYHIKEGKMQPTESKGPFVATITLSVDTFLDLIDAALSGIAGRAELVFERKYAARHMVYEGERWIVDSERFRKVFRRMGAAAGARG